MSTTRYPINNLKPGCLYRVKDGPDSNDRIFCITEITQGLCYFFWMDDPNQEIDWCFVRDMRNYAYELISEFIA